MATNTIKMDGPQVIAYSSTQTIPNAGAVTINVSSAVPTGKTITAFLGVQVGNYFMPYMAQAGSSKFTYVETANTGDGKVVLRDTGTGGWTNYKVTITFIVA